MNETISVADLKALFETALQNAGLSEKDAETTANILVAADRVGLTTHGAVRLKPYVTRLRNGGVTASAQPTVDQRAPSLALVDGKNAIGPVVGQLAVDTGLKMVKETGIAYVGCRGSNHFGAMVPYAMEVCDAGYVMFSGTGASTTYPPFGGTEKLLGNNPVCYAAPCDDPCHFILDVALAPARGKIRAARDAGQKIPLGWAVGPDGKETDDPVEALKGNLLPIGGHKGSGLAMTVDLLGAALTGASFMANVNPWTDDSPLAQGLGHFFIMIDPGRLIGKEAFASAMREFTGMILKNPPQDPANPVRFPGQMEQALYKKSGEEGITLPDYVMERVRELAAMPPVS